MTTVLVVDDEPLVRDVVTRYLEHDGHRVVTAADCDSARALIESEEPSLVLLDVMLPGETNGLDLCRWIRSSSELPVILLTARVEEADRIVGLELGADDYVTKPFSPRELAARVRALLRRASTQPDQRGALSFGDVVLDGDAREVRKAGGEVALTAKEFDLLWFLASHPRRVFSRDQLMTSVWGYEPALETGTVTVHVRRLRRKVEADPARPRHLQTVWGVGYRLVPLSSPGSSSLSQRSPSASRSRSPCARCRRCACGSSGSPSSQSAFPSSSCSHPDG
jgi:DNA-binding response OmpR family regulator